MACQILLNNENVLLAQQSLLLLHRDTADHWSNLVASYYAVIAQFETSRDFGNKLTKSIKACTLMPAFLPTADKCSETCSANSLVGARTRQHSSLISAGEVTLVNASVEEMQFEEFRTRQSRHTVCQNLLHDWQAKCKRLT